MLPSSVIGFCIRRNGSTLWIHILEGFNEPIVLGQFEEGCQNSRSRQSYSAGKFIIIDLSFESNLKTEYSVIECLGLLLIRHDEIEVVEGAKHSRGKLPLSVVS